jgi:hypothetical protein
MPTNPEEIFHQGSELLMRLFAEHEFVFELSSRGDSSGGRFASAQFRRGNRRFEFHFRFSLGLVSYHLGTESVSHEEYMCSVLGKPNLSHYPGFSNDPLDAFRDLREDIQNYCIEFLEGTNEVFQRRIEDAHACWASRPKLPA